MSSSDSHLISALIALEKCSPKLVKSSVYPAPAEPTTLVRSWKMNEFKYYDIPSPFPTYARGLFTIGDRIVVRGYDKFFNIGEVPWTQVSNSLLSFNSHSLNHFQWSFLESHTRSPYILSLKSNGCIIFIAALSSSKLVVTSKHSLGSVTGQGLAHAVAGDAWLKRYLEQKEKTEADLAKHLWDNNWTAVAEVRVVAVFCAF
jgi:tRNA ligase